MTMFGDIFIFIASRDATGIQWVEIEGAVNIPTSVKRLPTTKQYLISRVNSASVEKPGSRIFG